MGDNNEELQKMLNSMVNSAVNDILSKLNIDTSQISQTQETVEEQSVETQPKKRGRKKKNPELTEGQVKLDINDKKPSIDIYEKSSSVMKNVYKLLSNPKKTKYDIAQYLREQMDEDTELRYVFGDLSDYDLSEIYKNNLVIQTDNEDIPYITNENNQFEVLDVVKMDKNVKKTFVEIPSIEEARFLEDIYYQTQSKRIVIENQIRSLKQGADNDIKEGKSSNNKMFLEWYLYNVKMMEDQIKKALEVFSDNNYLSKWAKQVIGIGPVFATRLVANREIKEDENGNPIHCNSWWSYCGLNDNRRPWLSREQSKKYVNEAIEENGGVLDDETVNILCAKTQWKYSFYLNNCKKPDGSWDKEKLISYSSVIPYNKKLKPLMYQIGHSFMLCKNNENSLYGRLLKERTLYENTKNERGNYADQAAEILNTKNIRKNTVAYQYYSKGQLPPAHINQRCQRYVTKMFISHLYEAAYYNKYNKPAPLPYVLCFCEGHTDYIGPEVPYDSVPRDEENK